MDQRSEPDLGLLVCVLCSHQADVGQRDNAMLATCPGAETKPQVSCGAIMWEKGLSQHQKNDSKHSLSTPQWLPKQDKTEGLRRQTCPEKGLSIYKH